MSDQPDAQQVSSAAAAQPGSAGSDPARQTRPALSVEQRNRELADLAAIVATITSSLDLQEVLQSILNALPSFFPAVYSATVQLAGQVDGRLYTHTAGANVSLSGMKMVFEPGEGIAGLVYLERRSLIVPDVARDPRYTPPPDPPLYHSLLASPLLFRDQALGVLCITSEQVDVFDEHDLALLESLAGYAAIAVQNARLYDQAQRYAEAQALLLSEVSHRVKNNLASILALISLEKSALQSGLSPKSPLAILNDLGERIRGLLAVHEQLSMTRWAPLLATKLVRETVHAALSGSPIRSSIDVQLLNPEPGDLWVLPGEATNLSLVVNELVTNSIKYAFAGRERGQIEVRLSAGPKCDLRLEYRDDGPGWPADVLDGRRSSLGLALIRSAVRDQLQLSNRHGAVVSLTFVAALAPASPAAE